MNSKIIIHKDYYYDRVCLPGVRDLFRALYDEGPDSWITAVPTLFFGNSVAQSTTFGLFFYEYYGEQTYVVGPRLQWGFARTQLNVEDLKLPYKAFYIALPDCPYSIWGGPTGWHHVTGCYVWRVLDTDVIRIVIWGKDNEKSFHPSDDSIFCFDVNEAQAAQYKNYEEYFEERVVKHPEMDYQIEATPEIQRESLDQAKMIMRIVLNAIIYLSSYKPVVQRDTTNLEKRKRLQEKRDRYKPGQNKYQRFQRKLNSVTTARITYINPTIENGPSEPSQDPTPVKGHMVCGHWQRYHIGPNKSVLVRKWKDPYPRGDLDNMEEGRIYKPSKKIEDHAVDFTSDSED